MNHSDILLPFALPPPELAKDLQRALTAPALAMLTSRHKSSSQLIYDDFARALPHETWLAQQFGLADTALPVETGSSPALAAAARKACGLDAQAGTWFLLAPVQLHVARDHLVLADRRSLMLTDIHSRALFASAAPLFEEFGHTLQYGAADTWLLRADAWQALSTSTPDAASGHNIDIWLPKGPNERHWRKLQNEIQMAWHDHPVNQEREQQGLKPVNSLWLWGGTAATSQAMRTAPTRYPGIEQLPGWPDALADLALGPGACAPEHGPGPDPDQVPGENLQRRFPQARAVVAPSAKWQALLQDEHTHGLFYDTGLTGPALAGDWSSWLLHMHRLETALFAPALEALRTGKLASLGLILTHGTKVVEYTASKRALARFWIKPSLSGLFQ